jgi:hypothetical protein
VRVGVDVLVGVGVLVGVAVDVEVGVGGQLRSTAGRNTVAVIVTSGAERKGRRAPPGARSVSTESSRTSDPMPMRASLRVFFMVTFPPPFGASKAQRAATVGRRPPDRPGRTCASRASCTRARLWPVTYFTYSDWPCRSALLL